MLDGHAAVKVFKKVVCIGPQLFWLIQYRGLYTLGFGRSLFVFAFYGFLWGLW